MLSLKLTLVENLRFFVGLERLNETQARFAENHPRSFPSLISGRFNIKMWSFVRHNIFSLGLMSYY
jgi:hypothetical protein